MTKTAQRILADAMRLPQGERAAVASSLLETLEPPAASDGPPHEEWLAEVERRARAALDGRPGVSWEEGKARILDRLRHE